MGASVLLFLAWLLPGVVAGVTVGVLTWMLRSADAGEPIHDSRVGVLIFRHGPVYRYFPVATVALCSLLAALMFTFRPPASRGEVWVVLLVLSLCALAWLLVTPLFWEALRFVLAVTPEGLDCRSPWRGRRFVAWGEVETLSYSRVNWWFVIHARGGYRFRVSLFVAGLDRFLECMEQHLEVAALEKSRRGYAHLGRRFPEQPPAGAVDLTRWGEGVGAADSRIEGATDKEVPSAVRGVVEDRQAE